MKIHLIVFVLVFIQTFLGVECQAISNCSQLMGLSGQGNYYLTSDIACSGIIFTPNNVTFNGTFDGGGHTISGITITQKLNSAIFLNANQATFSNIIFDNFSLFATDNASCTTLGVLVAHCSSCKISNVTITSSVGQNVVQTNSTHVQAGALVGVILDGNLTDIVVYNTTVQAPLSCKCFPHRNYKSFLTTTKKLRDLEQVGY